MLIATDLEQGSEDVVRSVAALNGCNVERILLLHVQDERLGHSATSREKEEKLKKQSVFLKERGLPVESLIARGVPFDEIIHRAERWGATMVVLGPGKAPSWASSLIGSTTLRVLELSPLPVLVCPAGTFSGKGPREMMMAMDFSSHAIQAYEELLEALRDCRGFFKKLSLVHIHEQTNVDLLLKVVGEDQIDALIDIERSRLDRMARQARETGIGTVNIHMGTGRPVDQLLEVTGKEKPDILVLGAQGQGASDKYRIGKAVYRLAHMAPCGVLVVPLSKKGFPI